MARDRAGPSSITKNPLTGSRHGERVATFVHRDMQVASRHPVPSALTQAAQSLGSTRGDAGQLRRGFDRSLIPMVIVDNDRRHVEVNAAARLLARMSLRELRGL